MREGGSQCLHFLEKENDEEIFGYSFDCEHDRFSFRWCGVWRFWLLRQMYHWVRSTKHETCAQLRDQMQDNMWSRFCNGESHRLKNLKSHTNDSWNLFMEWFVAFNAFPPFVLLVICYFGTNLVKQRLTKRKYLIKNKSHELVIVLLFVIDDNWKITTETSVIARKSVAFRFSALQLDDHHFPDGKYKFIFQPIRHQ